MNFAGLLFPFRSVSAVGPVWVRANLVSSIVICVACSSAGPSTGGGDGERGDGDSVLGGMGGLPTSGDGDEAATGGDFGDYTPKEDEFVGPAGQAFVPAEIPLSYVGMNEAEFEVVASTLLQEGGTWSEPTWYVAVKNVGEIIVCIPALNFEFFNSGGVSLAKNYHYFQAPMYLSYGDPRPCLGPGDVGMGEITLGLQNLVLSEVAYIEYSGGGALTLSATRIEDIVVSRASLEPIYESSFHVIGTLHNGSNQTIRNPDVSVYAVDPIGRPYALMEDIELVEIVPGGSWSFDTLSTDEEVESFVVYPDYRYPL